MVVKELRLTVAPDLGGGNVVGMTSLINPTLNHRSPRRVPRTRVRIKNEHFMENQ